MTILEQLERDEGLRLKPYRDQVGKLTIGIGRNLDDVGISEQEARMLLNNDIEKARRQLYEHLPWVSGLDDARFAVLLNMAFNMGIAGLLGFHNTLALVQAGSYAEAAASMLQSKWAKQVGPRAERLSEQMRTGEWH